MCITDCFPQSVASSSESESISMRGISSSPSCSSSFENRTGLGTMVDGPPVLSEVIFESATVERSPIELLAASGIIDDFVGGGGGFVVMTDNCSLGSLEG